MAVNRFVLNTISYHGKGAIKEIPGEISRRGYKKAFVCSDPDLVKFGVTAKVTNELDAAGIPFIKLGVDQQMRDFGQAATAIQAFADVLSVQ